MDRTNELLGPTKSSDNAPWTPVAEPARAPGTVPRLVFTTEPEEVRAWRSVALSENSPPGCCGQDDEAHWAPVTGVLIVDVSHVVGLRRDLAKNYTYAAPRRPAPRRPAPRRPAPLCFGTERIRLTGTWRAAAG